MDELYGSAGALPAAAFHQTPSCGQRTANVPSATTTAMMSSYAGGSFAPPRGARHTVGPRRLDLRPALHAEVHRDPGLAPSFGGASRATKHVSRMVSNQSRTIRAGRSASGRMLPWATSLRRF